MCRSVASNVSALSSVVANGHQTSQHVSSSLSKIPLHAVTRINAFRAASSIVFVFSGLHISLPMTGGLQPEHQ